MNFTNILFILTAFYLQETIAIKCISPYEVVGKKCVLVVKNEKLGWAAAREYCSSLSGDSLKGDLLATPDCDDFTQLARYLEISNAHEKELSFWMGATRSFGESWTWITLDSLSTGVPFFTWDEGEMDGEDCAALNGDKSYKMFCSDCEVSRNFICTVEPLSLEKEDEEQEHQKEAKAVEDCEIDGALLIGNNCYIFKDFTDTWEGAERECLTTHGAHNGQLFYARSCYEFTKMAHYLEASEKSGDYWIGAIDVTGNHGWTWTTGDSLSGGVPFWAYGEPNHHSDGKPKKHCAKVSEESRYYMVDEDCSARHKYICEVKLNNN